MRTRILLLGAIVAGGLAAACQEASTAPRKAGAGPRFATVSDTGGGGGGGGGGSQVLHFVANGDNGYVNWFTFADSGGGGFSYTTGFLGVERGGTTNNAQTLLSYYVYQFGCDVLFNCFFNTLAAGYGLIPNKDLSGGGGKLRLNTNTAADPNFLVYAGPSGSVSVNWNANGLFESTQTGTNKYRFGSFTQTTQGSSTTWSASAVGSVIGNPIASYPYAQIGTNHNVQLYIYH